MDNGLRRAFGSGQTFMNMGLDFGDVVSVSDEDISLIPEGPNY